MNKEDIRNLSRKYLAGKATEQEKSTLHQWYNLPKEGEEEIVYTARPEKKEVVKKRLYAKLRKSIQTENKQGSRYFKPKKHLPFAATILLILSAGLYFYQTHYRQQKQPTSSSTANVIEPGRNKAVLILANGSKIVLDDSVNREIANLNGVRITKNGTGQLVYMVSESRLAGNEPVYNTIVTPAGGQYQINLPDGTRVWLNAASSLKYPLLFMADERKVELNGEGYFEVAKNKAKPFRVMTSSQVVEVLGTSFNVKAYQDEGDTKTTLIEGTVKVCTAEAYSNKKASRFTRLSPGQQAILRDNLFQVNEVAADEAIAWKNGYFIFNDEKIESIMRKISRWYDVEVAYQGKITETGFTGRISRFANASEVLEKLQLTNKVHFKIEGRRVTVMR